ncbi:uncharacterized protein BT62DRAFT_718230 [Guyanagaster necrorhizus]|uniref:Uncharacterized protein n=1 Tax=Guyanagaster necrorhizus TaxID=856835 RepID=A0A9P7VX95_9AGAR|nr:uncharacterized protein BT62DRAFT_718230 [Guyanagaster necrorhizus MCA 3950]KAG7448629.1 hypothetical protein BT62DRAFT_718230 [Guyanagaster necrorhizus MCA 3950]
MPYVHSLACSLTVIGAGIAKWHCSSRAALLSLVVRLPTCRNYGAPTLKLRLDCCSSSKEGFRNVSLGWMLFLHTVFDLGVVFCKALGTCGRLCPSRRFFCDFVVPYQSAWARNIGVTLLNEELLVARAFDGCDHQAISTMTLFVKLTITSTFCKWLLVPQPYLINSKKGVSKSSKRPSSAQALTSGQSLLIRIQDYFKIKILRDNTITRTF